MLHICNLIHPETVWEFSQFWHHFGTVSEHSRCSRHPQSRRGGGLCKLTHSPLDDFSVERFHVPDFEAARKQKDKTAGATKALEDTKLAFKRAQKKEAKQKASGKSRRQRPRVWFVETNRDAFGKKAMLDLLQVAVLPRGLAALTPLDFVSVASGLQPVAQKTRRASLITGSRR